jgi:hypothetical protein
MKAEVYIRMTLGAEHHLLLSSQPFLTPRLHEAATTLTEIFVRAIGKKKNKVKQRKVNINFNEYE